MGEKLRLNPDEDQETPPELTLEELWARFPDDMGDATDYDPAA